MSKNGLRVLYILPEYLPDSAGGIITHYRALLPRLVRMGHEVHVLVCNHQQLDRQSLEIDGVKVDYLRSKEVERARRGLERFRRTPTLWAFLPLAWAAFFQSGSGSGYDIIEATDWMLLMAPWVTSPNTPPCVVSLHGSCGQVDWHESGNKPNLEKDTVRSLETSLIRLAPAVHANSIRNAEFWEVEAGRKVTVIPPAFEVSAFPKESRMDSRRNRGLVVGRLQNWKGPETLAAALALSPGINVDWIGRDVSWMESHVLTSAHLHSRFPSVFGTRIVNLPPISHEKVLQEMGKHAFVCVPSDWDVFNLTVAEAMSLGKVVIASSGAGASMLVEDGVNGFIFPCGDAQELAAQLKKVAALGDEARQEIGKAASETVARKMAPDLIAKTTIDHYRKLEGRPAPPRPTWIDRFVALSAEDVAGGNDSPAPNSLHFGIPAIAKKLRARLREP